jgi:branched-chain amino acid transport system ATP-binding protein
MPLLEISSMTAGYGSNAVLHGIDAALEAGEIVTLVGANGAGKSTLVKSISGLIRPLSGTIMFEGRVISQLSPAQRLRAGIAHVPEGRQVFAGMTVAENLDLGAYCLGAARRNADRFDEVCELFPVLRPRLDDLAGNFSGGQQQMLAIARGLMSKPRLLLLDEPSLGIAPLVVAEIFRLIVRLRDSGISVLLAEQNARQALKIANRGYVMENGRLTISGPAAELVSSPEVTERYLGMGVSTSPPAEDQARMAERLRTAIAIEPDHHRS